MDDATVFPGVLHELREVVVERGMDDGIRGGRTCRKALRVFERAPMHLGPRSGQPAGACIRAAKAQHLMPVLQQLPRYTGANETGRAGKKHTHVELSLWVGGPLERDDLDW